MSFTKRGLLSALKHPSIWHLPLTTAVPGVAENLPPFRNLEDFISQVRQNLHSTHQQLTMWHSGRFGVSILTAIKCGLSFSMAIRMM